MNTKELIGNRIRDILVWSKMEVGGLDEGQVFIELTNGQFIEIPWNFDSENIETNPKPDSHSLIKKAKKIIQIDSVEFKFPENKSWEDIRNEVKENQKKTLFGRLKYMFGIKNGISKKYRINKTKFEENKIKKLENQEIVDFLMFKDSNSVGFLELENGNIISETMMSPHGTGMAGLNFYENIKEFEDRCGTDYKRLKKATNTI